MHHVDAAVDERVREDDLLPGDEISPVGAPVDGGDRDIPGPLGPPYPFGDRGRGRRRRLRHEVDAGAVRGRRPVRGHATGRHAEREHQHAPPSRQGHDHRTARLVRVPARPGGREPGGGQRVERLGEPGAAEVQQVIVRQYADVRARGRPDREGCRGACGSGWPCPERTRRSWSPPSPGSPPGRPARTRRGRPARRPRARRSRRGAESVR